MHGELSIHQIVRITCELELMIVRDFVSELKWFSPERAFERFYRDQKTAETESHISHMDQILSVAEEITAERGWCVRDPE